MNHIIYSHDDNKMAIVKIVKFLIMRHKKSQKFQNKQIVELSKKVCLLAKFFDKKNGLERGNY